MANFIVTLMRIKDIFDERKGIIQKKRGNTDQQANQLPAKENAVVLENNVTLYYFGIDYLITGSFGFLFDIDQLCRKK
jgi:hypothetical protein